MKATGLSDHDWQMILTALQVAADQLDQSGRIALSYGENKLWERVCEFRALADRIHRAKVYLTGN